jgi:hypothetical protein
LARFLDNPNFYEEIIAFRAVKKVTEKKPVWLVLLENIAYKEFHGAPMLAHNYCASRAREAYQKIKKLAKRDSVKISDVARHYRKLCNKVIQNGYTQKTTSATNRESTQFGFMRMQSSVNGKFCYSPNNRLSKKTSLPSIVKVLNNNFRMSNERDQKEDDEENEKEKSENLLDQIKRKNKLNIYVGGFETYTSKNPEDIEKVKIYEGKMCSTFFLNSHTKKKNYEKSTHGQIDVRKIIKKEGGIFIPNDVVKIKSKDFKEFKDLKELNFNGSPTSRRKISDISSFHNPQTVMSTNNNSPLIYTKKSTKISTPFNDNSHSVMKSYNSKKPSYGDFKLIPMQQIGQEQHIRQFSYTEYNIDKDKEKNIYSPKSKSNRSNLPTSPGNCRPESSYNYSHPNLYRSSSRNKMQTLNEEKATTGTGNSDNIFTNQINYNNYIPVLSSPSHRDEKNKLNFSTSNYNYSMPLNTVNVNNTTKSSNDKIMMKSILKNKSFKINNEETHGKFGNPNNLTKSANVKSMKHYKTAKVKKSCNNKKEAIMQYFNFFNKKDMYYD